MADRQTMNVSLPPEQEEFVRSQVACGRYRSASEVLRDGLRMLEEAEHRRLLEKWLYQDLSDEEFAQLPPGLVKRVQERMQEIVKSGVEDFDSGRFTPGPEALKRIRTKLRARKP